MKKIISTTLIASVLALATTGYATAQTGSRDIVSAPTEKGATDLYFTTKYYTDESAGAVAKDNFAAKKNTSKASKANDKAVRKFNSTYKKDMPDAKWSIVENGMIASFSKYDVKTNVVYNNKGSWVYTSTYYPASQTPNEITSVMDYAYPKGNILQTIKIEESNLNFYIVELEDKTTFKKISVNNGEVNLIEEYTKTK